MQYVLILIVSNQILSHLGIIQPCMFELLKIMNKYSVFARFTTILVGSLAIATFVSAASKINMRINMSAHIIASSIANLNDTKWTLYKTTSISSGDENEEPNLISTKLEQYKGSIKSLSLPDGQYLIKAQYGNATLVKPLIVKASTEKLFKNVKFVFNLAGLKLSSYIGNSDNLINQNVTYIVRNEETSKVELETTDPTKTYFLKQGDYKVTASYKDVVVTEANVKLLANNLNDIKIRHKIGQVNINIDAIKADITDIPPTWRFIGAKSRINKEITTLKNQNILLPIGDYQVVIEWNGYIYSQEFEVLPAQVIEFKLPKA